MRLFYFLCLLILISCKKEAPVTTLDINIKNIESEEITISGFDFKKKIAVQDLKASETLAISKTGLYTLSFGRNGSTLYLSPGDKVSIVADAKEYQKSVKIESPHTSIQEYIAQKSEVRKEFFGRSNFELEPADYLDKISKGKESLESLLSTLKVSSDFAAFEQKKY